MSGPAGFRDPRILLPFILITLIWSSTWIVIKDQLGADPATAVPPPWSVAYRFVIATAAMFAVALAVRAKLNLGPRGQLFAAAIGIPQFCFNFNFVYAAELYVTSGLVAVVFALLMVPNALFAWAFFGQRTSARFLAGSAVALAGVALLFAQEMRAAPVSATATLAGIGLTLLAVLSASVGNVLQLAGEVRSRSIVAMLAWGMLYAAVANTAFAAIGWGAPVVEARPGYWLGLAYLGVIATVIPFFFYIRIVRAVGPAKAAYSSVLIPILAMGISTVAEGYRWSTLAIAGGILAIAGLILALSTGRIPAPAPPD